MQIVLKQVFSTNETSLFSSKSSSNSSRSNTTVVVNNKNTYILYNSISYSGVFRSNSGQKSKAGKPRQFPTFSIETITITSQ